VASALAVAVEIPTAAEVEQQREGVEACGNGWKKMWVLKGLGNA
jgi:hypothetical protein